MLRLFLLLTSSFLLISTTACALLPGISGTCTVSDGVFPKPEPDYNGKRVRDFSPFEEALAAFTPERATELDGLLLDKTIVDLTGMLDKAELTSEELTIYYIDRIQRYDVDQLNAVMELNPQALDIARSLDEERANGRVRGNLHGIPILLKDNIATGDGLHATAGAAALAEWQPDRDAFLVKQLRNHGAIILGKANLSEWANWMDECMPNGFSVLGGQTRNPHGPFDTYGSSSGSAVAASANLAAATVGSETQGSIIAPAEINSVVAIKTSLGLVSRDYVIPLYPAQDVPGPLARTVTDAAVLLTAMSGSDENDPATANASALAGTDFAQYLQPQAISGQRVGIAITPDSIIQNLKDQAADGKEGLQASIDIFEANNKKTRAVGEVLANAGFKIVEIPSSDVLAQGDVNPLLTHGYKLAINRFLADLNEQAPAAGLDGIIKFNNQDRDNRAPYGQDHLEASQESNMSEEAFNSASAELTATARSGLDQLFAAYDIALIAGSHTQAYAQAGYPALTVPAGTDASGQPVGTLLIGPYLSEPDLINAGYVLEKATQARLVPTLGP